MVHAAAGTNTQIVAVVPTSTSCFASGTATSQSITATMGTTISFVIYGEDLENVDEYSSVASHRLPHQVQKNTEVLGAKESRNCIKGFGATNYDARRTPQLIYG